MLHQTKIEKNHFNYNQNPDIYDIFDNSCSIHYFYDKYDMLFDMKRVCPTNLPFIKRVYMPSYADAALEAKFTLTKSKLLSDFSNYTQRHKLKCTTKIKAHDLDQN